MAGYVTVAEVRAEGAPSTVDDTRLQILIDTYKQLIETATGQWFESRALTALLDGTDANILFLPVPVIALTALYVNEDFVNPVPVADYRVYNRVPPTGYPDDRRNPKIGLVNVDQFRSIFTPPSIRGRGNVFAYGKQNQKLIGTFGFVEADGTTPLLIKRAQIKLVIEHSKKIASAPEGSSLPAGPITTEMTDGHMRVYSTLIKATVKPGTFMITGDPEVDWILAQYKRPIRVGVPLSATFEA